MSNQDYGEQLGLDLQVIVSHEEDGVEMGVLSDETAFLTGRGLAGFCGISNSTLVEWGEFTPERGARFRAGKMAELLAANGFEGARFFEKIPLSGSAFGGSGEVSIYTDRVCMAFLEYYAFEAGKWCTDKAKNNFRVLARKSLKDFIYQMTGYDPVRSALGAWKHFHDRQLLNPVPAGYFSVFKQTADIVLESIRHGLVVDDHTIPDGSLGKVWVNYWEANNLTQQYGKPIKYPHIYPDYFPQAKANGSIEAWIYPCKALGVFVEWLQTEYLPLKFPEYLSRKVKKGAIPAARVQPLLQAVTPISLPPAS